jgi:hypothetical protein
MPLKIIKESWPIVRQLIRIEILQRERKAVVDAD